MTGSVNLPITVSAKHIHYFGKGVELLLHTSKPWGKAWINLALNTSLGSHIVEASWM